MRQSELKKIARESAVELEKRYNPYFEKYKRFNYKGKTVYAAEWDDCTLVDREDISKAYIDTATKDFISGYNERMTGYYDKWYRYNHADSGAAYDEGQKLAASDPKCSEEFHIIECQN